MREQVAALGGLDEGPSRFGGDLAWRRGGREVGHVHPHADALWLDLRLPPAEQRKLRDDPRVVRRGRSAWAEVRVASAEDARFAAALLAAAR